MELCSHNTRSRILFYLGARGKRIRCPGANSGRFLVSHGPPKAGWVNKTLGPTIVVPLLRACHSIFDGSASRRRFGMLVAYLSSCKGKKHLFQQPRNQKRKGK